MQTLTRRTALAVPVTFPLLPVAAYAAPADPLLAALPEWQAIRADTADDALHCGKDRS